MAALENPARKKLQLLVSDMRDIADVRLGAQLKPIIADRARLEKALPPGAVHQGIALSVLPLEQPSLHDFIDSTAGKKHALAVLLDQVLDPHNVGAIMRSALAFGADAVIGTHRHSAPESAVLAKSSSGAIESLPLIEAGNLVQAMDLLKKHGFWAVGLDGSAALTLRETTLPEKIMVVMGAEGSGLRRLTAERCDYMARIDICPKVESLNVSNACAITLYEISGRR